MMRSPEDAPILTAAAMRAAENAAFAVGVSQDELMERAGLAVARHAHRLGAAQRIVVLAGPGNNGGDAYVAARHLSGWGHDVTVVALGRPREGAAARMAALWTEGTVGFAEASPPNGPYLLVDGLFGTGSVRALELDPKRRALFTDARFRIAIDVPSGVDADTGATIWAPAPATLTVALGALKPAHVLAPTMCGAVVIDDLGLAPDSDWRTIAQPRSFSPGADQHKYRALVSIVAGAMPGAARLAARGAVGAGAGYVVLVADPTGAGPLDAIVHRATDDEERGVLLVGPGLGRDVSARHIVDAAIASGRPLVLDGDALTLPGATAVDRLLGRDVTVLTPHAGEFTRMFGDGDGSKIARTVAAAKASGATIVHKGHSTVIADPDGCVRVSTGGSTWLATAGTGDVLAGAVAACVAASTAEPAADAVWLHARASVLAGAAFSADRLADMLRHAVAECR